MKTLRFQHFLGALLLWSASAGAFAQEGGAGVSADERIRQGLQTLRQIDEDRSDALWDAASPVLKTRFPKTELVANFQKSRATLGTVSQRTWASVNRVRYLQPSAEQGIPVGLYANIDFSTRLTDGRTVFELLTFRQEADGSWRLMGYVPRHQQ